jgi:hypothetical protein
MRFRTCLERVQPQVNENGHPATLVASQPGNRNAERRKSHRAGVGLGLPLLRRKGGDASA